MRQFAWYCVQTDMICLQSIMEDCEIGFEWDVLDMYELFFGYHCDPMHIDELSFIPLGEV